MGKPYRVQINDILSINIKSTNKEITELLAIFQPVENNNSTVQNQSLYFLVETIKINSI